MYSILAHQYQSVRNTYSFVTDVPVSVFTWTPLDCGFAFRVSDKSVVCLGLSLCPAFIPMHELSSSCECTD